jgi:hypothetical protein
MPEKVKHILQEPQRLPSFFCFKSSEDEEEFSDGELEDLWGKVMVF